MSEYIQKAHNVLVLLYHYLCPEKYRRVIFDNSVDKYYYTKSEFISNFKSIIKYNIEIWVVK